MINTLKGNPKIIGQVDLPQIHQRKRMIGKLVMLRLPDVRPGSALQVDFTDFEDLKIGRKQILKACSDVFGSGKTKTTSEGNSLFVWIDPVEVAYAADVRDHRFGKPEEHEVINE